MKLKRLIVHGFKSFKDKTIINFDEGITGIVGPNGCGKSNVVDALFWIMGEQSAKHLRGNSMKDVIFAGSSKYNPATWAEVSLVLSNDAGKHIHIGDKVLAPQEIQLTRKLYRNGESEYRINNILARLRDIQEIFMDTGAGAKSYSIIAQGEINRLVQARPIERRVMIEEVAGITKFKVRKKESLKKIDLTELNLNRLRDLKTEVGKNLKILEKQSEKANLAKNLKSKIRKSDLIVSSHNEFELLKKIIEFKNTSHTLGIDSQQWIGERLILENSLETERIKKMSLVELIEEVQGEHNELAKGLAANEERLKANKKNKIDKEHLLENRRGENNDLQNEKVERESLLDQLENELIDIESRDGEDSDLEELEEIVSNLKEEIEMKESTISDLRDEVYQDKDEISNLEKTLFKRSSRAGELSNQLSEILKNIEELEGEQGILNNGLGSEKSTVEKLGLAVAGLSAEVDSKKQHILEASKTIAAVEDELRKKSKEGIQFESKLNSLKEIREAAVGEKKGVRSILEKDADLALVGDLVRCEEMYTVPIENLLKDYLHAILPASEGLIDTQSLIDNAKVEPFDYILPRKQKVYDIEKMKSFLFDLGFEKVESCNEIVTVDNPIFANNLENVLTGMFIVREFSQEALDKLIVSEASDLGIRGVISIDGKIIYKNLSAVQYFEVVEDSSLAGQGQIDRNNQIVSLEASALEANSIVEKFELELMEKKSSLEKYKEEYESLLNQLGEKKGQLAVAEAAMKNHTDGLSSNMAKLEVLNKKRGLYSQENLQILEEEEEIKKQIVELQEFFNDKEIRLEDLNENLELQKSTYDDEREKLLKFQVEERGREARLKSVNAQVQDVNNQINRLEQKYLSNIELIKNYEKEIITCTETINELEALIVTRVDEVKITAEKLSANKDLLAELLLAMDLREKEVRELTTKINKAEKELALSKAKIDQFIIDEYQCVKNIWEKYAVNLRAILSQYLEIEDQQLEDLTDLSELVVENKDQHEGAQIFEFKRYYGQELNNHGQNLKKFKNELKGLGEINWSSLEEYERQKIRFNFLEEQEKELIQSLEDLKSAILHIDEKSKVRFVAALEEVNIRFQKVFPIIFGGGSASLKIVGNIDDPDSGVDIIARPPGKNMQNINLMSGGEKAMTAVSLIFSIFLVKPSPFCLLDEVDAPLDDANVGRFNDLLREMSTESQFILITHNKKTMEMNDVLYGVTMQEPGVSKAMSVQLQ